MSRQESGSIAEMSGAAMELTSRVLINGHGCIIQTVYVSCSGLAVLAREVILANVLVNLAHTDSHADATRGGGGR
jgi:hypothetical protein